MLEGHARTPKSTSNLPNHRCSRRVSEHAWDSITSRKGTSVCEGTRRDFRFESSYLCHESARNRHSKGARTSDLSPSVPSRPKWAKRRYCGLCQVRYLFEIRAIHEKMENRGQGTCDKDALRTSEWHVGGSPCARNTCLKLS